MKNTDGSKLGESEINSLVVTVYLKNVCKRLADPSQTFNAAIEILQQKDGVVRCDIAPEILGWPGGLREERMARWVVTGGDSCDRIGTRRENGVLGSGGVECCSKERDISLEESKTHCSQEGQRFSCLQNDAGGPFIGKV